MVEHVFWYIPFALSVIGCKRFRIARDLSTARLRRSGRDLRPPLLTTGYYRSQRSPIFHSFFQYIKSSLLDKNAANHLKTDH